LVIDLFSSEKVHKYLDSNILYHILLRKRSHIICSSREKEEKKKFMNFAVKKYRVSSNFLLVITTSFVFNNII